MKVEEHVTLCPENLHHAAITMTDISDDQLRRKLGKIASVFDTKQLTNLKVTAGYVVRYYLTNRTAYSLFHTTTNFVHMGITRGEKFRASDMEGQPRAIDEHLSRMPGAKRVLEIGTGRGANSIWLSKRWPTVSFFGVDLSPEQLSFARRYANEVTNFNPIIADFHDLGVFADRSFDIVFVVEALCHSSNKAQVLREVRRVLVPGGKFFIFDGYRAKSEDALSSDERSAAVMVEHGMAVERFEQYDNLLALADQSGFIKDRDENLSREVVPTMRRFEVLAKGFFKVPPIARIVASVLPTAFTYNSISGYLMPILMGRQVFSYWMTVLSRPS